MQVSHVHNCFFNLQTIDYEGFKLFMETYLDCEVYEELCKHLFLSFIKRPAHLAPKAPPITPILGKSTSLLPLFMLHYREIFLSWRLFPSFIQRHHLLNPPKAATVISLLGEGIYSLKATNMSMSPYVTLLSKAVTSLEKRHRVFVSKEPIQIPVTTF